MLTGKLEVDTKRRYTVAETAELLGMCRKTLRKYTASGDIIVSIHPITGKIFYEGGEIQRFFYQKI